MAVVEGLIRKEDNQTLSFGDYTLTTKTKLSDFEFEGDLYKIKTYDEITKLEKNGMFVYESVPGTSVFNFKQTEEETTFTVEGKEDAQITLELEPEQEFETFVNGESMGIMKTNLGGKLMLSASLEENTAVIMKVVKVNG
ncbi:hypothetical protein [Acetivibrio ethanolgignens]|uniref:Endosialidase n=1 Tax=Acetivibrio ethanolgignens TaxID=290052 RepID=A0A0V8QHK7_9FIRM|nr:hypothetical protein [Acetivibrio ethanolgignens]KSV60036.1 endosialidase [Acetivibrio ethanolgignens]